MARTIKTTVYNFSELSEEAKQNAINKLYDINICHNWWEFTFEDAKNIGLETNGFDLENDKISKGEFMYSPNEVAANILKEHGEVCKTYLTAFNFMEEWQPIFSDYMNEESEGYESRDNESKMQQIESEFLNSLLGDYLSILKKEYNYLTSEECIIDTIETNEYEFTEEGELI